MRACVLQTTESMHSGPHTPWSPRATTREARRPQQRPRMLQLRPDAAPKNNNKEKIKIKKYIYNHLKYLLT